MIKETITVPFEKLSRVVQIGDVHIRLYKRHQEYREAFETLYTELRKTNNDETVIVVTGDCVHAKCDLSPEMVDLTSDFLSSLADIAPTLVIAGNHDANLANNSRLDSLSPIIKNINNPNLHYLRDSGVYKVADVDFAVLSIFGDRAEWPTPADTRSGTIVALFHGPVHDAKTDVGYTITNRHMMIEAFEGFDIAMLGDIHSFQCLQKYSYAEVPEQPHLPAIVYQGSLIQQNHGEKRQGHGWVEWDIENRDFTFFELENKYGYYTLEVKDGIVPDYSDMPEHVRLRIFAGSLTQVEIKSLVSAIRKKHTVHELAVSNFAGAKSGTDLLIDPTLNIHDINYQNKLITEYLKEATPSISDDILEKVIKLNKEKNEEINTDDLMKKIFWKPISLEFSNLFTYGDNNYINFESQNGVVGIFAPNASGKTSIAEAICFALYDRTPRTTKAVNIMNYSASECYCKFAFDIGEDRFVVVREGKKNKKGEVKMDVDFTVLHAKGGLESLNGEERRYTNEIIRSYVGDYEDFILTTFSSSAQAGIFVDRGQSDRKDLLSQFMGLALLDRLFALASDESKEIAGALKRFKNDDFTQTLVDLDADLLTNKDNLEEAEVELEAVNTSLNSLREAVLVETEKKLSLPNLPNTTSEKLEFDAENYLRKVNAAVSMQTHLNEETVKLTDLVERGQKKLETDYTNAEENYQAFLKHDGQVVYLHTRYMGIQKEMDIIGKALEKNSLHAFNPECEFCVKNGAHIIAEKARLLEEAEKLNLRRDSMGEMISNNNAKGVALKDAKEIYEKWKNGNTFITEKQQKINENLKAMRDLDFARTNAQTAHEKALRDLELFEQSKDAIAHNTKIDRIIERHNMDLFILKSNFNKHQNTINSLNANIAVAQSRKDDILKKIEEAEALETKYEVYDAYLMAMCREGLPYKLITDILPMLEIEVNNILKQMVEFHLKFEMDGKNINMKLAYDDERVWPLELASGMEKFISSLAVRVSLTNMSNLPKSNFLIIDEGLGTLDPENLASISMLFDVLRTHFSFILLISHVEEVRDIADTLIEIKRENGVSQLQAG